MSEAVSRHVQFTIIIFETQILLLLIWASEVNKLLGDPSRAETDPEISHVLHYFST